MHDIIKAGLEIMRDPATCQIYGIVRDTDGCMCAVGCLDEASVRAGVGKWERSTVSQGVIKFDSDIGGDGDDRYKRIPAAREWMDELHSVVTYGDVFTWNDDERLPLPKIADLIETKYAEREALVADIEKRREELEGSTNA